MPVDKQIVDRQIKALGPFSKYESKKEVEFLPEILQEGETIKVLTKGQIGATTWLLVATDRRLIFLRKGLVSGLKQIEMPLSQISSVTHKKGLLLSKIQISSKDGIKILDNMEKSEVEQIANTISDLISGAGQPATSTPRSGKKGDIVLRTRSGRYEISREKLGSLVDAGKLKESQRAVSTDGGGSWISVGEALDEECADVDGLEDEVAVEHTKAEKPSEGKTADKKETSLKEAALGLGALGIVGIIGFILFLIFGPSKEEREAQKIAEEAQKAAAREAIAVTTKDTRERKVEEMLWDIAGEKVRWNEKEKPVAKSIIIKDSSITEGKSLKITYRMGEVIVAGATRNEMAEHAMKLIKKLLQDSGFSDVSWYTFTTYCLAKDSYGNDTEVRGGLIELSRREAEKVNWNSMDEYDFQEFLKRHGRFWLNQSLKD